MPQFTLTDGDLLKKTLRTTLVMLGSTALWLGALSGAVVVITGPSAAGTSESKAEKAAAGASARVRRCPSDPRGLWGSLPGERTARRGQRCRRRSQPTRATRSEPNPSTKRTRTTSSGNEADVSEQKQARKGLRDSNMKRMSRLSLMTGLALAWAGGTEGEGLAQPPRQRFPGMGGRPPLTSPPAGAPGGGPAAPAAPPPAAPGAAAGGAGGAAAPASPGGAPGSPGSPALRPESSRATRAR